jgi:Na+/H+-translocating membrane pyrophosphatase
MGNVGDLHGLVHEYHLFMVTVVAALTNGAVVNLRSMILYICITHPLNLCTFRSVTPHVTDFNCKQRYNIYTVDP